MRKHTPVNGVQLHVFLVPSAVEPKPRGHVERATRTREHAEGGGLRSTILAGFRAQVLKPMPGLLARCKTDFG